MNENLRLVDVKDITEDVWQNFYTFHSAAYEQLEKIEYKISFPKFKSFYTTTFEDKDIADHLVLDNENEVIMYILLSIQNQNQPEEFAAITFEFMDEEAVKTCTPVILKYIAELKLKYKKLVVQARSQAIMELCSNINFRSSNKGRAMRLQATQLNAKLMEEYCNKNDGLKQPWKISIKDQIKESEMGEYTRLLNELLNDQVREEINLTFTLSEEELMEQQKRLSIYKKKIHYALLKKDDQLIGMCVGMVDPEHPLGTVQFMTGVKREFRGKKLSYHLKAHLYRFLFDTYPDIAINTDCYYGNKPMIHINERFGFTTKYINYEMIYNNQEKQPGDWMGSM